jgi:nucleotide-binding universal stress UspA family protein
MNVMKSLLAATDFSEDAHHAANRAASLATDWQARLELLHVMSGPSLAALHELFGLPVGADAKLLDDAQHTLDELCAEISAANPGLALTARVAVGQVLDEILTASEKADMLILGARGLNPLRDLILGTTAERLLRRCKKPVLLNKRAQQSHYRQVIVPVDFSPRSASALHMARLVAPQAEISLVHAFGTPYEGKLWLAGVPDEEIHRYRTHARQLALSHIHALIGETRDDPCRYHIVVEHDDAAPLILAKEMAFAADLIVIGKHGQSLIEDTLLGSVTRHVLSDSKCDVLVVQE